MSACRMGLFLAASLCFATGVNAQSCLLAESTQSGDCYQVKLGMRLKGEIRIVRNEKSTNLPLIALGEHHFAERVMAVGASGLPEKNARFYDVAKVNIDVGADHTERTLRTERRLLVAQRLKDQTAVYCPAGALRRDELELTSEHFDTLAIPGLLPGKEVKVGDTWKLSNAVAQAICNFEGLREHSLAGKLDSVEENRAVFSIGGTASGIDQGAMVNVTVQALARFDTKAKRITDIEWKQKDERQVGPVSPESTVEITTTVDRRGIDEPTSLNQVALVSVPDKEPPSSMLNLECADGKGRFELLHARDWQSVSQTNDHTILRLVERGDFIAQATITPWKAAEKGQHLTPEEFKAAMNGTAGWEPERELQASEVPVEGNGRWAYRVSVQGKLDGVEVMQNFYLIAAPNGEQVVVAVTMTPKQADKLGARDLSLIASMEVPAGGK